MEEAIALSKAYIRQNVGGPFGCVVVKENKIIGRGWNKVLETNDPTAHAEICAIKEACTHLNSFQLQGCDIYTSCEPCPMCLGAIYWSRAARIFYANTREDAALAGFDDSLIYKEFGQQPDQRKIPMIQVNMPQAKNAFEEWQQLINKTNY